MLAAISILLDGNVLHWHSTSVFFGICALLCAASVNIFESTPQVLNLETEVEQLKASSVAANKMEMSEGMLEGEVVSDLSLLGGTGRSLPFAHYMHWSCVKKASHLSRATLARISWKKCCNCEK